MSPRTDTLIFWYLFSRRNRMYSHNIFLTKRFKLCLNPLKYLYLQCCYELLIQRQWNYVYCKISNIRDRFEMYKIEIKPKLELTSKSNLDMANGVKFHLFMSSLSELYMLCILLLNKNNCFYGKISQ